MRSARATTTPTGRERTFGEDEIIVSKTDVSGKITYANHVFLRVSGYTEDESLGAPHSMIRHPDMPRAIFKYAWDRLLAGHEVFAYVNNLAREGDNYWVLAHMTPTRGPDGAIIGFHSNRRVPDRAKLAKVLPLYEKLLAEERRHPDRPQGLTASTAMLAGALQDAGKTYDEWVWSL
ncbi:MAG: PAS domain-containing protein [Gemmatimonadota bacterium]|nr:PAS domain-containing protein [Gemmatimonadota bacterium]